MARWADPAAPDHRPARNVRVITPGLLLPTRRRLAANTVWSLVGLLVPAAVGIAATPAIVRGFGVERFGVLTLAWMVVGYFSLFDLGLGRAITRRVAELLAADAWEDVTRVVWTAWAMMLALGVLGALAGAAALPLVVEHAVNVSPALRAETVMTFWLLALSVPVVVFSTGARGVLEAAQRFGLVNIVRIPSGILTFVVPLVTLQYSPTLPPAIIGLLLVRLAGTIAYAVMAAMVLEKVARRPVFSRDVARDLLGFGAWMTVSNVISPLMVTFDRFAISAMISVAAVTYYAVPYEAASKIMFIPGAVAGVLFPALAAAHGTDGGRVDALFSGSTRALLLLVFPPVFMLICFAPEILQLWVGGEFPQRSTAVMQWLLFGMLVNSVGQLAYVLVQSAGRSDLTAKLHMAELIPYAVAIVVLMRWRGIEGAAIAWTVRVAADTALLLWLASRLRAGSITSLLPPMGVPMLLAGFCLAAALPLDLTARLALAAAFIAAYSVAGWQWGGVGDILRKRMLSRS